jgi:hypothetical protein
MPPFFSLCYMCGLFLASVPQLYSTEWYNDYMNNKIGKDLEGHDCCIIRLLLQYLCGETEGKLKDNLCPCQDLSHTTLRYKPRTFSRGGNLTLEQLPGWQLVPFSSHCFQFVIRMPRRYILLQCQIKIQLLTFHIWINKVKWPCCGVKG